MRIENTSVPITAINKPEAIEKKGVPLDGTSTHAQIKAKAREFEEIFIADSLKNAKIGMTDSSLVGDTKITDTFSTFMNQALAETIVSQGGFGLTEQITQSLMHLYTKNPLNNSKE